MAQNIKKTPYPHVIFTGDIFDSQTSFTLFADSTEIAVCTDVLTAITACFVVYWIFNIQYPKQFRNFLSFQARAHLSTTGQSALDVFIFVSDQDPAEIQNTNYQQDDVG